jgi:hypothetical protein
VIAFARTARVGIVGATPFGAMDLISTALQDRTLADDVGTALPLQAAESQRGGSHSEAGPAELLGRRLIIALSVFSAVSSIGGGLALSFTPGPFVDESTPLVPQIALWACGGLLKAYVMTLVTWQGARRICRPND